MICRGLLFSLMFLLISTLAKGAQHPKKIGHFGHWTAYTLKEGSQKICYMVSFPVSSKGNYTKRGTPFAMITHRPEESSYNVVSFHAGYTFASESEAIVHILGQQVRMLTEAETAWTTNEQDELLVALIAKASKLKVIGTSSRGTLTEDHYSLEGSARALEAITAACKSRATS